MSHSKHDRSLDELYGDFLKAHRALHGTVEAYQNVYLVKAQSELSRLENVIRILEDYKKTCRRPLRKTKKGNELSRS